ncbi:hypothetical protein [Sphingobium sp. UBA5915]|nr:hypothetical protein [Sphingobium sp. UBA5915]
MSGGQALRQHGAGMPGIALNIQVGMTSSPLAAPHMAAREVAK